MRKWMKTAAIIACIVALLAGCGAKPPAEPQQPEEEPVQETPEEETKPDITLEQVMEANRIENLLKNHSTVRIETGRYAQETDEFPVDTIQSQYMMKDGFLRMFRVWSSDVGDYYEEGYADGVYSGAIYAMSVDGLRYMHLCPAEEYTDQAVAADSLEADVMEERVLTDVSWQDNAAVLTVKTTYLDGPEFYTMTYYFVEPDTYELYAVDAYTYGTDDNDSMGVEKKVYTYDEAGEQEVSPFQAVIADKDYCELNVIVDYMGENQAAYWYPVAHGTQVSFQTEREDYSLYNDEEMTGVLGKYDDIDISGDAANLFVVYGR